MEKKPTTGLGVASLVTGIIALVSAFVPLLNLLSFPFVLLAIIFGAIGVWQTAKGTKAGKGIAVAGLVLGILALLVTVVMYGSAGAASEAAKSSQGSSAPESSQNAADGSGSADEQQPATAQQTAADYVVEIGDAYLGKDYQGNQAVLVEYSFTNNSDEAISPMVALHAKAFQNGVQLESAIGVDGTDASKSMSEIKPGASVSYSLAYVLEDSSEVTVEVEELFDFSNEILAQKTFAIS